MKIQTIKDIAESLEKKEFSCKEVTQFYLDRIKSLDKNLNSFITITEESALEQASLADKKRANNEHNKLTGVPIAHKDIFCTKGEKTTCASKMLDNFISPYDATVVQNMKDAGFISLGKTNMDEFAMGSSNETSFYGDVKNPWDTKRVPGGSSGGSAAAVASRLVPGCTGTDTGGSIRQPAAFCGVTGIKPTYGKVSRYGMIAFASSLDQAGPIAATAYDCALMLKAMSGFDEKDSTSINKEIPNYIETLEDSISGLRIGIPKEFMSEQLDSVVREKVEEAVKELEKMGAKVKTISLPNSHLSIPAYYVIAPAECSSNLSRFDGVKYGHRCENPKDLKDMYERSRSEGFGREVKRRILVGTYVLSAGYYDAYYVQAQKTRRIIKNEFLDAFKEVDIIAGPTTPETAFKIGEKTSDPVSMYLNDIYTSSCNLAGLPGMSVPAGFINNLPIGLQLIGNYFSEAKLLNAAHQYQKVTDWHTALPEII